MSSKVSNRVHKGIKTAVLKNVVHGQFEYLGRWVNKDNFRAFVYNVKGEQALANSYHEFMQMTNSGVWFDTIENARKGKKAALKADRQEKQEAADAAAKEEEKLKEPVKVEEEEKEEKEEDV